MSLKAGTTELSEEDQMTAALAERRAAKQSGSAEDSPAEAATTTTTTESSAAADPAASTEASTAESPGAGEGAAQPNATQEQKAADAQAPAAAKPAVDTAIAAAQAELHRLTSEIGRVSALNRKNQESAQEIARLREQLEQAQKPPETQSEARQRLAALAEQAKQFPELVSVINVVGEALTEVEKKSETVAKSAAAQAVEPLAAVRRHHDDVVEREYQAAYAAAEKAFKETYPTTAEVVRTPEFEAWLNTAPAQIQHAFHKGQTPQEAMPVMDAYDAHLRRSGKPSIAQLPQSQQQQPAAAAKSDDSDERLRRATGLQPRQNGGKGSLPPADDFDAAQAYFRQKRLAKAQGAAA
jgi:hypothetical protein